MKDSEIDGATALYDRAIRTIMVVDDSRLQRHLLKGIIGRMGVEVVEADSGEAALEILSKRRVDMILSDWMMGGMTGVEFCRRFRAVSGGSYVYFVLLTSKTERGALTEGLNEGADDFLAKPVNADELRARILAADRLIATERLLHHRNRELAETNGALERARDALERDLIEARRLQQALVPRRPLALPQAQASFLFQPSGHVGGDLVGWIPASDSHFGLFSLDVSGHGVAAAMITARLGAILGSGSPEQNVALKAVDGGIALRDPAEICALLNEQFLEEVETDHYFTLLIAEVDLISGLIRFAQAGHPNPLFQAADGQVRFLGEGGLPIGLIEGAEFDTCEVQMAPRDRLFLYSDGVTECPNPAGGMVEEEGLVEIFAEAADQRGLAALDMLSWRLNQLSERDTLPDDVSGVLLEWN